MITLQRKMQKKKQKKKTLQEACVFVWSVLRCKLWWSSRCPRCCTAKHIHLKQVISPTIQPSGLVYRKIRKHSAKREESLFPWTADQVHQTVEPQTQRAANAVRPLSKALISQISFSDLASQLTVFQFRTCGEETHPGTATLDRQGCESWSNSLRWWR